MAADGIGPEKWLDPGAALGLRITDADVRVNAAIRLPIVIKTRSDWERERAEKQAKQGDGKA